MKTLIVDDEKHVREGIRLLGDWEHYGIDEIYEAGNGEEAIALIEKHRPEIIFSDMKMPRVDGIQLLEWIKENHPNSKTIVVTGYGDYHYMRKAIHFGSADYILKPIDPEILNHTLKKTAAEWIKEAADRKKNESSLQMVNVMKPVYRDRRLTQLLNSASMKQSLYEEIGFQMSDHYRAALVRINGKTIEQFQDDRDLTYFTVLNVINEHLMNHQCGIAFRYLSNKGEVVILFWDKFKQLDELLVHIYQTMKKVLKISCPIALGKAVDESCHLIESYKHAKQLLLNSNILETKESRVYANEGQSQNTLTNLMSYSSQIELAVKAGEIGAFEEVIKQVTEEIKENRFLSLKQLLLLEKEYQVICNRWLKKYSIPLIVADELEKRVDLYFDEDGNFQLDQYISRKKREISIFLKFVNRQSQQEKGNILSDIEKYLQENFDQDVKLQEISDQFFLSREYISRKFKQEFKVNISDYLVKIRINKAKSLLKNSHLKIYEISSMIGYQDDKYFRKVFKKVEGMTPNEYRSNHH